MSFWQKQNKCFTAKNSTDKHKSKSIPGWSIGLCIGLLCLFIGLFHDQFTDIMKKAIMICLECIGIG